MLRVFQDDLSDPQKFVITLELIPGREPTGRSVDTVKGIAVDSFADGRISAVTITDNPGGNPYLSPDVIAHEIFSVGMDVIVHFTCRDMNRAGMESRALQLAMMGLKNILALTGDFTGKGFGGQGAPVFDLGSVHLLVMLNLLSERIMEAGDPDGFFSGCAVSPFKKTEAECFAQYAKMCKKAAAGARFIITQLGYDVGKFRELIQMQHRMGMTIPTIGTVYVLTPKVARLMNGGHIPGAVVTDRLLEMVSEEWKDPKHGREMAVERAARLAVILKGLGYRGMHIGGIHKSFDTAGKILDRMGAIEHQWETFMDEFHFPQENGFYAFPAGSDEHADYGNFGRQRPALSRFDKAMFHFLRGVHRYFFDFESALAPTCETFSRKATHYNCGPTLIKWMEDPSKKLMLDCRRCGDCGIQHVAFLCPESQCPKHTRNGACGGSSNGDCEVYPDRRCVWFRAYQRLASIRRIEEMAIGCVPPRMWELDQTSSWLNFHLKRDHQSASTRIAQFCRTRVCTVKSES